MGDCSKTCATVLYEYQSSPLQNGGVFVKVSSAKHSDVSHPLISKPKSHLKLQMDLNLKPSVQVIEPLRGTLSVGQVRS